MAMQTVRKPALGIRCLLSILAHMAVVLLATGQALAQIAVIDHQKISSTEGGFAGALDDGDGFCVPVGIGDLSGDGIEDMAVASFADDDGGPDAGAVWILFMNEDGTVNSHQKISETAGDFTGGLDSGDNFGYSVESLGDLDGEGPARLALAVAAVGDDDGGDRHGAVWILFLDEDGNVQSHQKISDTQGGFEGVLDSVDSFGAGMANLGDLDGDGVVELAVGANTDDDGGNGRGAVWVLFLNQNGTVRSHQKISSTEGGFTGPLEDNVQFGVSVAALGDLDLDGVPDLGVGVFNDGDGGANRGAVWILFLNDDGTVKDQQKISDTEGGFTGVLNDDDRFGTTLDSLGPLYMDAIGLAVGAFGDDDGGQDRGAVWVLFLDPSGNVVSHQKISDTEGGFAGALDDDDWFSITIGALGDLNGDGLLDLAVGAQGDDDGGPDRGAVYVLFTDIVVVAVEGPGSADLVPGVRSHLMASSPNPFNPRTTIRYELARPGDASVRIYDVAGHLVRSFDLSGRPMGRSTVVWDGRDSHGRAVAGGTYLVRLETAESADAMRVTLIR